MRILALIGIWFLLWPTATWGQQQPGRRKNRQHPAPTGLPPTAPLPAAPVATIPPGRFVVQGPIADLVFDPNIVFVIFTRPQLGCMIELPEKARTCAVTNPDFFSSELVPVGRRKSNDPNDPERDRRLLALKMTSPRTMIDGVTLETTLSVILESGRRLTCLIRPATDESQNVYEIRFRDPELERQKERLDTHQRQQAEETKRRESLLAADRARAEDRAGKLLATGIPATLATSSRSGDVNAKLFVEALPSFLVALVTVRPPSGGKLTPLTPVDWTLDGKLVTEGVRLQPLPPALLTEAVTEVVLLPYPNNQPPALVQCGFLVGRKAVKIDFSLPKPANLVTAQNLPVNPGRSEVVLQPKRNPPPPSVAVPVAANREPAPEPPSTNLPAAARQTVVQPPESGDAWKRLGLLAETTYDRNNGASEALTKLVRLRLYTERHGDSLLATLRLERRVSGAPIRIGTPRWTAGGKTVTPSRTTDDLADSLELQPVAGGYAFSVADVAGSLVCSVELNGKLETVSRPLETVATALGTPVPPPVTSPAPKPNPEGAALRKLPVGAASQNVFLNSSRIPVPGTAFRAEDIFASYSVPLPPKRDLPLAKPTEAGTFTVTNPPVTAAGVSLVAAESAPPPKTPVEKVEPPKTYALSKPQPPTKPATSGGPTVDRAEKQRQDRLRIQLKQSLAANVAAPLLKIKEGNVVLKVLSTTNWEGFTIYLFEIVCTDGQVQNLGASYTATNNRIPGFAADVTKTVDFILSQHDRLEIGDTGRFTFAIEGMRQKLLELTWETGNGMATVKIQP